MELPSKNFLKTYDFFSENFGLLHTIIGISSFSIDRFSAVLYTPKMHAKVGI